MRVILSVDAITPPLTGIGRYTWELATRLPALPEVRLRLYRQDRWISAPELLLDPDQKFMRRTWLQRQEPLCMRNTRFRFQCRNLIFHGPNFFLPPCADIGVITVHDLSVLKFPETHPAARIKKYEEEFNNSLARTTHLITVSEAMRLEIIDFLGWPSERITTVHNGVSSQFSPMGDQQVQTHLQTYGLNYGGYTLCVSTLEPRKKIENLLQAYQLISPELRSRYPLILGGSPGWLSASLHEDIERFTHQGWLRYLGFVPESDLPALYASARLFVYPSIYEGFGLPVLEAMTSGIPVVTSNRTSLPEVTGGAALLVDPDDIDMLTAAITRGLSNDEWRNAARIKGLAVAAGFSWDRCVEETVQVYKQLTR